MANFDLLSTPEVYEYFEHTIYELVYSKTDDTPDFFKEDVTELEKEFLQMLPRIENVIAGENLDNPVIRQILEVIVDTVKNIEKRGL